MPPRPLPFSLTDSSSSPALRLPPCDTLSNKGLNTATNFSLPFEPDFQSSPFVIPDFKLHVTLAPKSNLNKDKRTCTDVTGIMFRPPSSIYSTPSETNSDSHDDMIAPTTPSGSVFNTGNSRPSRNPPGHAITTTASEDQIQRQDPDNSNKKKDKPNDVRAAARDIYNQCRITALPSFSRNPNSNAKIPYESADMKMSRTSSAEKGKAKEQKRNSFLHLGRSFSINFQFGRKRRSTLVETESQKRHRSDLDVLDCFRAQHSTRNDEDGEAEDAAPGAAVHKADENSSLDPESAFLTPVSLLTTHETRDLKAQKRKSQDHLGTLKTKRWSQKKLKRMAKTMKVDKMQAEITRLNQEMQKLEIANTTLRARAEDYRAEWYHTNDKLIQEEFSHWETKCARSRDAIAWSEMPLYCRRLAEGAAQQEAERQMTMGQLLQRDDTGRYEAGVVSVDSQPVNASLARDRDEESEGIAEMGTTFGGPPGGAGVRSSWITVNTTRTGRGRGGGGDDVRESWITDDDVIDDDENVPFPEIHRTRTLEEATSEV